MDEERDEIALARRERDLYRQLLSLGAQNEPEPFLKEALALIVDVTAASQGFLELRRIDEETPGWWLAHGCSSEELDGIRAAISSGIIAEALATGETVLTPSALTDPRFRDRTSVHRARIESVLCAPIGGDPAHGVLYLQGRRAPGAFTAEDRERAEIFARHLAPFADRLLLRARDRDEADATRSVRERLRADGVVGHGPALAAVLKQAALVAPLDVNVLLTGESGTGKSQLARVIHDNGPRALEPFVELNCAALPETLVESELFGARPGAHSTAQRALPGKVAAAEGGTLFLDEIGELPIQVQAKLLQLLHSKSYYPLGAAEPVRADVRLVAATNSDLEEGVRERRFREDLFFRLQVLPIRLPSVAERREDLPELSAHFLDLACQRDGLPRLFFSRGAIAAIEAAEWPGNLRQLSHAIEAAAIRAAGEGSHGVEERHVFPQAPRADADEPEALTFQDATRRFQRKLLLRTLEEAEWNVTETARRLDLARSHVYNLIKAFGLSRDGRGEA